MSDEQLIENHTVFFAYFCFLIESDLLDYPEKLCEIGIKLDDEISRRKITDAQINDSLFAMAIFLLKPMASIVGCNPSIPEIAHIV